MENIVPGESSTIKLSKQSTKLWFQETTDKLYTQQQFSITYVDKGKRRIQTPAATPKGIQLPNWKKHRVESPTAPSYHYTLESTINILSADMSTSNDHTAHILRDLNHDSQRHQEFDHQYSNQILEPLLYGNYQRKKRKELQEPLQQPPLQQQLLQQPQQQLNVNQITYAPIAKLENFTSKEDDTQAWINDVFKTIIVNNWDDVRALQAIPYFFKETVNSWYQSLADRPQTFQQFKTAFLEYFSNNNSINCLANTFTTIKQNNTEVVTTYLKHFHRVLHQIQAINTVYFTESQILNQFICGLCSSILQHVHLLHPVNFQATVIHTRDFESAKLEANHAQALTTISPFINLPKDAVIRETTIVPKIKCVPQHWPISSGSQRCIAKSKHLPANDAAANLLSTSILDPIIYQPQTIQTPPQNLPQHEIQRPRMTQQNWRSVIVVHQLIPSSFNSLSGLYSQNSGTSATQNPNSQNYLSFLVTPEDATPSNLKTNPIQKLTSNISLAMVTENETLTAIFSFEFKKTTPVPLFSGAALKEKPIIAMYTDAKVDDHSIKLILDSGLAGNIIMQKLINQLGRQVDRAASAHIITTNEMTKTPIGKIDDFPFEINGIIIPIKVLHTRTLATCGHFKPSNAQPLIEFKKETRKSIWEAYQVLWANQDHNELPPEEKDNGKRKGKKTTLEETTSTSEITIHEPLPQLPYIPLKYKDYKDHWMQTHYYCKLCHRKCYGYSKKQSKWNNKLCLTCSEQLLDKGIWNDIPALNRLDGYFNDKKEIWQMANAKVEGTTPNKILEIKNNSPELVNIICIPNPDAFMDKKTGLEDFHKYYQNLAPIRKKQEHSCASKSELPFNPNSNSDNNDNKNTGSSSIQIDDNNNDDFNSDSNFDPKYEQYIALPDLSKEQELKWYSDNNESIMPEHMHNTNVRFDLRYPEKDAIKLEPHLHTCIDLKVALKIPTTTIIQLASRNSLVKREINIRGEIIDTGYVRNIIAMLQNNSKKAYIIELNKKIAQAIFLPLVKIAQLVSVGNREELGITARGIQGFESMGRIDVPVNIAEKKIVD
ncbi:hypothetical protein G9A89_019761 [Geosiphon pyriformis]|nr:hypothetical protein G9A89_019761 [Geosiphon pyriformis]